MTDSSSQDKGTSAKAAAKADPDGLPTGFPEPPAEARPEPAGEPRKAKRGHVILAVRPPVGSLTVPPLEEGGEAAVITAEGTEVDDATALRAHEAARLSGHPLREL